MKSFHPVLPAILLAPLSAIAAEVVLTADELARLVDSSAVHEAMPRAAQHDAIRALLATPGGDPASEQRLRELVLALPDEGDDLQVQLLTAVASREDSVFLWHDDDVHRLRPVVAISPAAAAQWKLARMHETRTGKLFRTKLQRRELDALDLHAMDETGFAAARTVLHEARATDLAHVRDVLHTALATPAVPDRHVTALAAIVAARLHDPVLAERLVEAGDAGAVASAMADLVSALPAQAQSLLDRALDRSELAPMVIASYGQLIETQPLARKRLLDLLGDADLGPAVAATLARTRDASLHLALYEQLQAPGSVRARHAALALYLDGTDGALAQLARHVANNPGSALRPEIEKWLAH